MKSSAEHLTNELALEQAGRTLLSAIISGRSWTDSLEELMPKIGCFGSTLSRIMPPGHFGVPTDSVKSVFGAIASGKTPPMTSLTKIVPNPYEGFVCDQIDKYRIPRERDSFYQEFIRPAGLSYQASAYLDAANGRVINFLIFRNRQSGGFDPKYLKSLSICLPYIRAAVMASRAMLQIEATRIAGPYVGRGDPVLHIGSDGLVRDCETATFEALAPLVTFQRGRLVTSVSGCQNKIDLALKAVLVEGNPSLVTMQDGIGISLRLLFLPVIGEGQDLFGATAALVVALDISRPPMLDEQSLDLLATASGLTRREAEVTRLVISGHTPRKSADILDISYETVRLHLRNVYAKLGVHGQIELIALVNRLSAN